MTYARLPPLPVVVAANPLVVGNVFTAGAGDRSVEKNVFDIIVYSDVGAFIVLLFFTDSILVKSQLLIFNLKIIKYSCVIV